MSKKTTHEQWLAQKAEQALNKLPPDAGPLDMVGWLLSHSALSPESSDELMHQLSHAMDRHHRDALMAVAGLLAELRRRLTRLGDRVSASTCQSLAQLLYDYASNDVSSAEVLVWANNVDRSLEDLPARKFDPERAKDWDEYLRRGAGAG